MNCVIGFAALEWHLTAAAGAELVNVHTMNLSQALRLTVSAILYTMQLQPFILVIKMFYAHTALTDLSEAPPAVPCLLRLTSCHPSPLFNCCHSSGCTRSPSS